VEQEAEGGIEAGRNAKDGIATIRIVDLHGILWAVLAGGCRGAYILLGQRARSKKFLSVGPGRSVRIATVRIIGHELQVPLR